MSNAKQKAIDYIKREGFGVGFDHNNIFFKKALDMALSEQKKELKQRLFEVLKKERLEITNPKLVLRVIDKVFD